MGARITVAVLPDNAVSNWIVRLDGTPVRRTQTKVEAKQVARDLADRGDRVDVQSKQYGTWKTLATY